MTIYEQPLAPSTSLAQVDDHPRPGITTNKERLCVIIVLPAAKATTMSAYRQPIFRGRKMHHKRHQQQYQQCEVLLFPLSVFYSTLIFLHISPPVYQAVKLRKRYKTCCVYSIHCNMQTFEYIIENIASPVLAFWCCTKVTAKNYKRNAQIS